MRFSRGSKYTGYQVACPFHKDPADANKGTRCTRTMQFGKTTGADDESEVVNRLREWCLLGRFKTSRQLEHDGGGHKGVPVPAEPHSAVQLKEALERALSEPNWIVI